MPTLVATPWPRGPVAISMPEVQRYSGCPGHLLSSWRKHLMSCGSFTQSWSRFTRAPFPAELRADSALYEREQVRIDHVGMRRAHAMWKLFVDLQHAVLQQLHRQQCGVGDRHELVVVAVHHQRRDGDGFQVFGEARLGEGLDAVVVCLRAPHHALAPPG